MIFILIIFHEKKMVLDKQYTNLNLIINNKIYVYVGVIIILRSSNVLDNFTRK